MPELEEELLELELELEDELEELLLELEVLAEELVEELAEELDELLDVEPAPFPPQAINNDETITARESLLKPVMTEPFDMMIMIYILDGFKELQHNANAARRYYQSVLVIIKNFVSIPVLISRQPLLLLDFPVIAAHGSLTPFPAHFRGVKIILFNLSILPAFCPLATFALHINCIGRRHARVA
jgi:hypothetical protein